MRKLFSKMDIPLFVLTIFFMILGLVMIYSASSVSSVVRYGYAPYHFFIRQAIFVSVSLLFGLTLIIKLPTRNYSFLAWPALIIIILALAFLFINGKMTNNAVSWYDLGFFNLQPSEFAKSILIVFTAIYYNKLHYQKVKNYCKHSYPSFHQMQLLFQVQIPDMMNYYLQ